jgi:hypothetical protein
VAKVKQAEGVHLRNPRRAHLSQRGPRSNRAPRPSQRLGPAALAGTAAVAILAVVVVVLAVKLRDDGGTTRAANNTGKNATALETRVAGMERELTTLRKALKAQMRITTADFARVTKRTGAQARRAQLVEGCVAQLQDEVDDLQTYLTYGTPPRASRVSGACVNVLKPRFSR